MFAIDNKYESISILKKYLTDNDKKNINIDKAFEATKAHFGNDSNCGFMYPEKINLFLNWLVENQLEHEIIKQQNLFSNELFT